MPLKSVQRSQTILKNHEIVTDAANDPVTVDEAKEWLNIDVDFTADDTLISNMITACMEMLERESGYNFFAKTCRATFSSVGKSVQLPYPPVTSITSVKYLKDDFTTETLTAGEIYQLVNGLLEFNTNNLLNYPIEVVYVSGYTASNIPEQLKQALKRSISYNYEHRGDVEVMGGSSFGRIPKESLDLIRQFSKYSNFVGLW